jgi:hypothetical protein
MSKTWNTKIPLFFCVMLQFGNNTAYEAVAEMQLKSLFLHKDVSNHPDIKPHQSRHDVSSLLSVSTN